MYGAYFQLECRPFDLAPDPRFLYMTAQHSRATYNLRFALRDHDSFVVITGEIGTGKTTVLNKALMELGPQYVTARLSHTTLTDIELLQSLLSAFGIPNYTTKRVKLLDELRNFFLSQHLAGKHVVIIVDEAQHLNPAALEELRLLACLDSQDRRIVSIVLTGQPTLDDRLDDPSLVQLRQRTRLRQRLQPMNQAETLEYIRHRLKVAGGDADRIFAPETLPEIYQLTRGIPRLINTLCDTAMISCSVESHQRVELSTLQYVVQELGWAWAGAGSDGVDTSADTAKQRLSDDRATLTIHLPGKDPLRVDVHSIPFNIGRNAPNELLIDANEISRRHAVINRVDGQYIIEDLKSRNGMLVNGKRCQKATLKQADTILIGPAKLVFQRQEATVDHAETQVPGSSSDATWWSLSKRNASSDTK